MYKDIVSKIRSIYGEEFIPLHVPVFNGNEKKYLNECIDSTYVSSVGKFVDQFEIEVAKYVGAKRAIAVCNGTMGLHASLHVLGVDANCDVITQALSFTATANAIAYTGASPVFIDVDRQTLGMSPDALKKFIEENYTSRKGVLINDLTGNKLGAIVPMHTFGHPCEIDVICELAKAWNVPVVEDAAESIGSTYKSKQTGTFGDLGVFSFNGNKTITSGGGGVIVTNNDELADKLKYITTTAKIPHKWEYRHSELGFNYRMPNLNAALALAQLEQLEVYIKNKRSTATKYKAVFDEEMFIQEPEQCVSNYWLNALLFKDLDQRNEFLEYSNSNGVMTRPVWDLLNTLPMYTEAQCGNLKNANYLADRLVNIPSSVII